MTTRLRPFGIVGLLVATSAWGSLFLVGKPVLAHVDPVWFTFVRYTLASVGFALLLAARGAFPWDKLRAHAPRLALLGFVGYGVFSAMVLLGLMHSVPSHGAVIMATMPITTQLVRWLLDGTRPAPTVVLGTALALAGVVVVSGVLLGHDGEDSTAAGDLITLAGTLGWIGYTRGSAGLASLDVLEYSGLTAIASWPLLLASALAGAALGWTPLPSPQALEGSWHALLYIGVFPSVVAILAFNFGVRTLGVVTGTAFLNFVPVSALLMGTALGTRPAPHELLGVAMVIAALLIHTLAQRRVTPAFA
ncbi:MAG TPA: DMT family transporter [Albitalea sp.]|nr:DMT family transporter [Albitalea sp.]